MNISLLAGSLAGVLLLYLAARALGLGGDPRLATAEEALALAAAEGFDGAAVALDREGRAALVRDSRGRHLLLRRHGAHFVARPLVPPLEARLDAPLLTVATDGERFGGITLDLGPAAPDWAASLGQMR